MKTTSIIGVSPMRARRRDLLSAGEAKDCAVMDLAPGDDEVLGEILGEDLGHQALRLVGDPLDAAIWPAALFTPIRISVRSPARSAPAAQTLRSLFIWAPGD